MLSSVDGSILFAFSVVVNRKDEYLKQLRQRAIDGVGVSSSHWHSPPAPPWTAQTSAVSNLIASQYRTTTSPVIFCRL